MNTLTLEPIRLRAARVSSGLSIGQAVRIAALPNLTTKALIGYETDTVVPAAILKRLATIYHFSVADILAEPLHFRRIESARVAWVTGQITEAQFFRWLMLDAVQDNLRDSQPAVTK